MFGEWVGPGIQAGCAIHKIPKPIFAIFAVQTGDCFIIEPHDIVVFLVTEEWPEQLYVLPWFAEEFFVNLSAPDVDAINVAVDAVEAEDPWVKEVYGISGIGEGLVLYPASEMEGGLSREQLSRYMFKAKGEEHRVKKAKVAVEKSAESLAGAAAFVEAFVTEARLKQGFDLLGDNPTRAQTGDFLKWIGQDILKESAAELDASGLPWKDVAPGIAKASREWLFRVI